MKCAPSGIGERMTQLYLDECTHTYKTNPHTYRLILIHAIGNEKKIELNKKIFIEEYHTRSMIENANKKKTEEKDCIERNGVKHT